MGTSVEKEMKDPRADVTQPQEMSKLVESVTEILARMRRQRGMMMVRDLREMIRLIETYQMRRTSYQTYPGHRLFTVAYFKKKLQTAERDHSSQIELTGEDGLID